MISAWVGGYQIFFFCRNNDKGFLRTDWRKGNTGFVEAYEKFLQREKSSIESAQKCFES